MEVEENMSDAGFNGASAHNTLEAETTLNTFRDLGERWRQIEPGAGVLSGLADTVESELLPRFMIAFQSFADGLPMDYVTEVDRERFFALLLADDTRGANGFIHELRRRHIPMETICGDLLAHAARMLGERWNEDRLDFTDVTIAMARLQQLLRMNSVVGDPGFRRADGSAYSVVLVTARGEQHTFGVHMLAEAFRRDGWFVCCEAGVAPDEVRRSVHDSFHDVIGVSASTDRSFDLLAKDIDTLRSDSRNPDIHIIVGGGLFQRNPELADEVGAAFCLDSAIGAPMLCRGLLAQSLVGC